MKCFTEGDEFEGGYPPEAADWCNCNDCAIEETTPEGAGARTFRIVSAPTVAVEAPPDPAPTREELAAAVAELGDVAASQTATMEELAAGLMDVADRLAAMTETKEA